MNKKLQEIYCDFNGFFIRKGTKGQCYSLEGKGSIKDFEKAGLTRKQAVGKKFTFYQPDSDNDGTPNDVMFDGIVVYSKEHGYFAEPIGEVYWRNDKISK